MEGSVLRTAVYPHWNGHLAFLDGKIRTQSLNANVRLTVAMNTQLAEHLPNAQLITGDGTRTVRPGINVLPLTVAKGLEFDFAVVTDWDASFYQDPQFGNNRRYVAASRGTKRLILLH